MSYNAATLSDTTSRVTKILDANYEKANLQAVVEVCTNLTPKQQRGLYTLLKKYKPLFNGTLGDWKNSNVSINLKPDAKPYHGKTYGVPHIYEATFYRDMWKKRSHILAPLAALQSKNVNWSWTEIELKLNA